MGRVLAWTAVLDGGGDGLRPFPVDNGSSSCGRWCCRCPQGSPRHLRRSGMVFCLGNSERKKPEMLMRAPDQQPPREPPREVHPRPAAHRLAAILRTITAPRHHRRPHKHPSLTSPTAPRASASAPPPAPAQLGRRRNNRPRKSTATSAPAASVNRRPIPSNGDRAGSLTGGSGGSATTAVNRASLASSANPSITGPPSSGTADVDRVAPHPDAQIIILRLVQPAWPRGPSRLHACSSYRAPRRRR